VFSTAEATFEARPWRISKHVKTGAMPGSHAFTRTASEWQVSNSQSRAIAQARRSDLEVSSAVGRSSARTCDLEIHKRGLERVMVNRVSRGYAREEGRAMGDRSAKARPGLVTSTPTPGGAAGVCGVAAPSSTALPPWLATFRAGGPAVALCDQWLDSRSWIGWRPGWSGRARRQGQPLR